MITPVTIIQARMSSTRLPGKVLMKLGDGLVLDQVVRRAQPFSAQVVVCTSVDESDDAIVEFCNDRGLVCVRGPLDDVFMRYRMALEHSEVRRTPWFARVTADCPLLSSHLARHVLDQIAPGDDYACVVHDGLPRGLAAEFVCSDTFLAIDHATLDRPAQEHVTLHLYENPDRYRCRFVQAPAELAHPELRLTLDYDEDYQLLERLFAGDPQVSAEQAVQLVVDSAELRELNARCVQKEARPPG